MNFTYVYILRSRKHPDRYYTGITDNLEARLRQHNDGCCDYTRAHRPWGIKTAIAFTDRNQARAFELYLKTPSGRAFAKKRL